MFVPDFSPSSLAERQLWTLILSVSGIGKQTFSKILDLCQRHQLSLEEWWNRVWRQETLLGLDALKSQHVRDFRKIFTPSSYAEYLQEKAIKVVLEPDPEFPALLKECDERPLVLFVKGDTSLWNVTPLAVVGTRKMTGYGQLVTQKLVTELVNSGVTIISGGMYGVDLCAHHTALEQQGRTVAVLGCGFDHWYPEAIKKQGEALLAQGATLVTEFPPFMPPIKGNFPSRNRIVAGMSVGVLVTEAGLESGSHITAGKALDYGREVFAVPGPITNPYSQGTKWLVNQGATLVTSADDILEELGYRLPLKPKFLGKKLPLSESTLTQPLHFDHPLEKKVYQEIEIQPLSSDDLIQRLDVPIDQLTATLSQLEIKGFLKRQGVWWMLP
jgi:DNA processing protein